MWIPIILIVTRPSIDSLPDDKEVLKHMVVELLTELDDKNRENEQLREQIRQLKRLHYGPRSERIRSEQMLFSFVSMFRDQPVTQPLMPPEAASRASVPCHHKHGRGKPPAHLPRIVETYDLPPGERCCPNCDCEMVQIGAEESEEYDYEPASIKVRHKRRIKYACKNGCQKHVETADLPAQPVPKGSAGPALLAHVVTSKYADHLPLNRQEGIFKRFGIKLNRSTLCGWIAKVADLLDPMYWLMKDLVLKAKKIHTDDIPVPVLDRSREHTRKGRMWFYGDATLKLAVYDYSPSREKKYPEKFLENYEGYMHADAYPGYDDTYESGRVVEVACWSHSRRHWFNALQTDKERTIAALGYIGQLYMIEVKAKNLSAEERKVMRQALSAPVLESFKKWLDQEAPRVLPKSPIGKAFKYTLNQWIALNRYLEDGNLQIDNNFSERSERGIAVGRKNWCFLGSDAGGRRAAVLYSLVESCKLNGIDPFMYLRDVISRIATHSMNRLEELLPGRWVPPSVPENTS